MFSKLTLVCFYTSNPIAIFIYPRNFFMNIPPSMNGLARCHANRFSSCRNLGIVVYILPAFPCFTFFLFHLVPYCQNFTTLIFEITMCLFLLWSQHLQFDLIKDMNLDQKCCDIKRIEARMPFPHLLSQVEIDV